MLTLFTKTCGYIYLVTSLELMEFHFSQVCKIIKTFIKQTLIRIIIYGHVSYVAQVFCDCKILEKDNLQYILHYIFFSCDANEPVFKIDISSYF